MANSPEYSRPSQEWPSEDDLQTLRAFEELWKLQMQYPVYMRAVARGLYYLLPEEEQDNLQAEASHRFPDDEGSWRQFIIERLVLGNHERPNLPAQWPNMPRAGPNAFDGDASDQPPAT